ncbi:nickel ABC transporter permease [Staphylococcus lutrae]|uniref:Nickel import system permease protein NikB n=1 Tax=Staphylococcus lutrae TaxID=155085 RepID=A0AAC9RU64_9STAP|nr:nickel ABC transporter permease [Staphylococcus lutrae]ARJ51979.1 peptide ABC transporter permease [Staphylococcus lutrae]PNZ39141.1 ABC transporter permease [Staphylococcus lutrae]
MTIKRLLTSLVKMVIVLWVLATITFILMKSTPGDPVNQILHVGDANVSKSAIEATRVHYGLNDSWWVQYGRWLGNILQLDFGTSYQTGRPVIQEIGFYTPPTLTIAILTIIVVMAVALPLGVLAARYPNGHLDRTIRILTSVTVSLPSFFLGMLLLHVFALRLKILPVSGYGSISQLVLPVIAMSVGMSAYYVRLMRAHVIDLYRSREVAASRLRGLSERYIFFTDVLKPALVPIVTILGLSIGSLIGGTVVIENVFGIPGLGQFLVDSIRARDYPVIQGIVLMLGLMVVLANLASDAIVLLLDPKQRYMRQSRNVEAAEKATLEVSS